MTLDEMPEAKMEELKVGGPHRLSTPTPLRIGGALAASFLAGTLLGVSHGSRMSGMRFRAENSHRLPTTSTGWYLYHKTKNYHVLLGGIKEGLRMGFRTSFWTGGFFIIESAVDSLRHRQDCLSSAVAGLTIAGNFAVFSKYLDTVKLKVESLQ